MELLGMLGGIVALIAYLPLFFDIARKQVQLNIATWLIWTVVDGLLLSALIASDGIPFLAAAFLAGDFIVIGLIFSSGRWHWGIFETVISIAAVVALCVWWQMGALNALITVVLIKYCIASIPSLRDAYHRPEQKQVLPWLIFTLGIAMTLCAAGPWNLASSFYPSVALVINGALALLHMRRQH